jgi:hypothetical protein
MRALAVKFASVILLSLAVASVANGQSRKFVTPSPDGRFDAICDFTEAPPFKIVERASGKALLSMDDERVGNHGLDASWSPDSKTLVVLVQWRLGIQIQVCRFVGEQFERTEGPNPPEDFLTIDQWDGSTKLRLKGDKRSYALEIGPTGARFEPSGAATESDHSIPSLVGTWTRHADTVQYLPDGTYRVRPRYSAPRNGKWRFDGQSLTHTEHGKTWTNKIVSLSATELKMRFPDGSEGLDYQRVGTKQSSGETTGSPNESAQAKNITPTTSESQLIGIWQGKRHTIQYFPDHSFKQDGLYIQWGMKWRLDGKKLARSYPDLGDNIPAWYPGAGAISVTIVSITPEKLVTEFRGNKSVEYRIKSDTRGEIDVAATRAAAEQRELNEKNIPPRVTQNSETTPPAQTKPSATAQNAVTVAFEDIDREVTENPSLFERKYRGKVIRVRLPVLQIEPDEIFLGPEALGVTLRCNPRALSTAEIELLRVGREVTVTGTVEGTGHKTVVLSSPHITR